MGKVWCILACFLFAGNLRADSLIPISEGTTWQYEAREEIGGQNLGTPAISVVTVRIGKAAPGNAEGATFETLSGEVLSKSELMSVTSAGLVRYSRTDKAGKTEKFVPSQTIIPGELKIGVSWEFDDKVADMKIHPRFTVAGEESITVSAGKFRAFHFHGEASSLMAVTLDRWFVPGIGFVKDTTVVRGPTGGILQRVDLELKKRPELAAKAGAPPTAAAVVKETPPAAIKSETPQPTVASARVDKSSEPGGSPPGQATPINKRLLVEVSSDPAGGLKTEFKSDTQSIYVRWHGHDLPAGARVRVAWIAEDVGDIVEPNFVVDETETTASAPDASARFTLGRPPDGWAEGRYRLEFYIDDVIESSLKITITK